MNGAKHKLLASAFVFLLMCGLALHIAPAAAQTEDEDGDAEKKSEAGSANTTGQDILNELIFGESEGTKIEAEETTESEPAKESAPPKDMRGEKGLVSLDFNNTDINEIVKTMSEMTGRNFMLDKSVSGTVTIISPTKVTSREAYDIFLSVLAVNGFTTVDVGKITKIIPRKDAKQNPITTVISGLPRPTDEIITQLIPLKNIDCNDIASAFQNLVGPDGELFAYGPSNMVIVSDAASNVNRLYRIIMQLDTEGADQQIDVIPLEYADAESMAGMIEQLFEDEKSSSASQSSRRFATKRNSRSRRGGRRVASARLANNSTNIPTQTVPSIIADTRTNSLIVKSSSFGIERVREIVRKLDQPQPGGEGKIHVIYLENADSEELAGTLSDLAGGGGSSGMGSRGSSGRNQRSLQGGTNNRFGNSRAGALSQSMSGRFGAGGRGGAAGSTTGRGGIAQTSGRLFADFDGAVQVTADPATNSLVIVASNRDFKIIKEVIDKLDIPRRQVFVEAVIMEITMERGLDLGFEFRSTNDAAEEGIQVIGGTNYGGIQEAAANPLGVSGFAVGAVDGTITYAGQEFPNIGALFRAMQTDRDVNVLSTPNLLTMDNEEAEIVVADNVPFVTGQIFSQNNSNPVTTIERQDVGITLRITPQINESDYVRLDIFQESSQVTDSPEGLAASQVGVTTSKRTTQTLVVVKDRQAVILGGLMKDNMSYVESKIPILGDIPILGYLFKSTKKKVEKTNLLIFLTPYIIKDATDLEEVTRMANQRMRVFRENAKTAITSDLEDTYINEQTLSPSESAFRAPRQGTIETDPRLRKEQENPDGDSETVVPDTAPDPKTEDAPTEEPADESETSLEDFTEDGGV
jgi:general secretion pathway protein D